MTTATIPDGYKAFSSYFEFSELFDKEPWALHEANVLFQNRVCRAKLFPVNYVKRIYHLHFWTDDGVRKSIDEIPLSLRRLFEKYTFLHT
jgi:hypothetical protein